MHSQRVQLTQTSSLPLRKTLNRQLMWIGFAFTICCLLLVFGLSLTAVNMTSSQIMRIEARAIVNRHLDAPQSPLPRSRTLSAFRHWEALPENAKHLFPSNHFSLNTLQESIVKTSSLNEYWYLYHHYEPEYGDLYLLSRHTANEVENVFFDIFLSSIKHSLLFTFALLLALFLLISWLIRRTLAPLTMLSQWADHLNHHDTSSGLNTLKHSFPITELNQIAEKLEDGIQRIHVMNQREQQFLKAASHELRTPLATIQASLDTIALQTEQQGAPLRTVTRALRASHKMTQLTETLLWLAREEGKPLAKEDIALHQLWLETVAEHQHLTPHLSDLIQLTDQSHQHVFAIETQLVKIVMANIMRNALQHGEGPMHVTMLPVGFRVNNVKSHHERQLLSHCGGASFGLGLQLVERICSRQGWQFQYQDDQHQVHVELNFQVTLPTDQP